MKNNKERKTTTAKTIRKRFEGVVVSDKQDKTITVLVKRVKVHGKYSKRYILSRKYKAHDEKNKYKEGDKVAIVECRPLSKDKKWRALY